MYTDTKIIMARQPRRGVQTSESMKLDLFRVPDSTQLNQFSENVQNFATGKKLGDFQVFFQLN